MCYLGSDHITLATNSEKVVLFHRPSGHYRSFSGHSAIVLTLDVTGDTLVTGSRDNSIRLWKLHEGVLKCVAIGTGHTHYVGAVALSRLEIYF